MRNIVYVGLSGPTYYDYKNRANRASSDLNSSPNPILENAFGLAVFYEEIWFLCESLCPQSLRGQEKVKYVDQLLSTPGFKSIGEEVGLVLDSRDSLTYPSDQNVIRENFEQYWNGVRRAGVHWWEEEGTAIDNHTHRLGILNKEVYANSNHFSTLCLDLRIVELLRKIAKIDIALNSFTKNLHGVLYPSQYHPSVDVAEKFNLGAHVINAKILNSVGTAGPSPEVFEKVYDSPYVKDFRRYLSDRSLDEAGRSYIDVISDIESAIRNQIGKSARNERSIKGLVNMIIDAGIDALGIGTFQKVGKWYLSSTNASPLGAAAFLHDLE